MDFFLTVFLIKIVNPDLLSSENEQGLREENIALKKDKEHLESRIEKSIEEFNKQKEREQALLEEKGQVKF